MMNTTTRKPKVLWGDPGLDVTRKTTKQAMRGLQQADQLLNIDLDMTTQQTTELMENHVLPYLDEFSDERLHIRNKKLLRQPTQDFLSREEVFTIEFAIVELALSMGERWPLSPRLTLIDLIKPYQRDMVELEKQIKPFSDVVGTLEEIRRRWPRAVITADTNCPTWLGLLRAHHSGVLPYLDAIVGVKPEPPDIPLSHPFWKCVEATLEWIDKVVETIPHDQVQLEASVPWWRAKPNTLGLRLLLDWSGASQNLQMPVASCGDNPLSEGKVVKCVNEDEERRGAPIRFIRAAYGAPDADPAGIPVDAEIQNFRGLIDVLEQLWR